MKKDDWDRLPDAMLKKTRGKEKYSHDEFVAALISILDAMTGEAVLQIPGVFEAVSEEFNNEALEKIDADREVELEIPCGPVGDAMIRESVRQIVEGSE